MRRPIQIPTFTQSDLSDHISDADIAANRFTEAALVSHKNEGLLLAVRARWVALAVVAIMLPFLNPRIEVLWHEALLLVLAINGYVQMRIGTVGQNRWELLLLFVDLAVTTVALALPNPFSAAEWPDAMAFRFGNFAYFYVILACATLMYSWRTIFAVGNWTAALWMLAALGLWFWGRSDPALTDAAAAAFGTDRGIHELLDPNAINFDIRIQEIVVFLIVSATLAISVRRFNRLLLGNAELERERSNLSRYFSPNVVDELSQRDGAIGDVREQDAAVLFVDLVGFTGYAAERPAREVIKTLQAFHGRMEDSVFQHGGTLDKYLGDGLMATFGTPFTGVNDAKRALDCAQDMLAAVDELNAQRKTMGQELLRVSIGLHVGPVVMGDIGTNRLEFAVIGNTVNVASRMEGLTRSLEGRLILSDEAFSLAQSQGGHVTGFDAVPDQAIRGLDGKVQVWRTH